jgi:negative regulator of flagellin synthesis FlgM
MNIKGVGYTNGINYYNKVTSNKIDRLEKKQSYDRIELSEVARTLNDYSLNDVNYDNSKKILEIKNMIHNGVYKCDAKLIAKEMIYTMRGQKYD